MSVDSAVLPERMEVGKDVNDRMEAVRTAVEQSGL